MQPAIARDVIDSVGGCNYTDYSGNRLHVYCIKSVKSVCKSVKSIRGGVVRGVAWSKGATTG
jgi:hypothetical protein